MPPNTWFGDVPSSGTAYRLRADSSRGKHPEQIPATPDADATPLRARATPHPPVQAVPSWGGGPGVRDTSRSGAAL
jgi:hypothetical protein